MTTLAWAGLCQHLPASMLKPPLKLKLKEKNIRLALESSIRAELEEPLRAQIQDKGNQNQVVMKAAKVEERYWQI